VHLIAFVGFLFRHFAHNSRERVDYIFLYTTQLQGAVANLLHNCLQRRRHHGARGGPSLTFLMRGGTAWFNVFQLSKMLPRASLLVTAVSDGRLPTHYNHWPTTTRSSYVATCDVRKTRTSLADRPFTSAGPRLWNNLPVYLRNSELTLLEFRR